MKNVVLAMFLALASSVALASDEVGAFNPQLAGSASSILDVAIADTGASDSWAVVPYNTQANVHQMADLKSRTETINQSMNTVLETVLERKLLNSLEY